MRALCVVAGIASAAHYHCMANFVTKAPHFCKLFVLPGVTGSSVGLVYSALKDEWHLMLLFSVYALCFLIAMNLIVWNSGAHVAKHLARRNTKGSP